MKESIRKAFLEWSKTEEYKQKVENAKKIIRYFLKFSKKPYVAYSGGKDSTVLLHLVLQEKEDVTVLHWDYGKYYIPRSIEREIIENAKKIGAKNIIIETSKLYDKLKRNARSVFPRELYRRIIPKMAKQGYDLAFIGLRAEESISRRKRTKNYFEEDFLITNCYPIRDFTWRDVWAYIVSNNLPYLKHYDIYGELIGYDKARFVTILDKEFEHVGGYHIDKVIYYRFLNVDKSRRQNSCFDSGELGVAKSRRKKPHK